MERVKENIRSGDGTLVLLIFVEPESISFLSSFSLTDVEAKCKAAAALKLPLSQLELNKAELLKLFQVSTTALSFPFLMLDIYASNDCFISGIVLVNSGLSDPKL